MMKRALFLIASLGLLGSPAHAAQPDEGAPLIEAYVLPFYDADGPVIHVGRFSAGLASSKEDEFVRTIEAMRAEWSQLTFPELYVASIRLYDLGYRDDAVYWFYTAQLRARQFGALLERTKPGKKGQIGFELLQAHSSFVQRVGPTLTAYTADDPELLSQVLARVEGEGKELPDLAALYPEVRFRPKSEWAEANDAVLFGFKEAVRSSTTHVSTKSKDGSPSRRPSKILPQSS
jgi:hypothetical protein